MKEFYRGDELSKMADEIDIELGMCEKNLKKIGSVAIKIHSFGSILDKQDQNNQNIRQLQVRRRYFHVRAAEFTDQQARERGQMEKEMEDAKIGIKHLSESHDPDSELREREFYSKQSNRLDEFIMSTMDSLDSVKRQGVYIQKINEKLKSGLERLGVSGALISKIEARVSQDKTLFTALFCITLFMILLLRFYFK
ncbi:hypothetical protein PAEPH01_1734 [Pancytospora epiphaga]|nr:hypothetical protein PAEPH01_1734 [Pancytospora epiphaga]